MNEPRVVVWFSCGAASAVAAKLAIDFYGFDRVVIAYCDTSRSEHPDNIRFRKDVESWTGKEIQILRSEKYLTVEDVFSDTSYMSGIKGARCTTELKKIPRLKFQLPDDIHIFGFTVDERKRIANFQMRNPELKLDFILWQKDYSKEYCFKILRDNHIELPTMYKLGYRNNNCLGCVKATSPGYWNKVRQDFPEVFKRRCEQSRELGVKLTRVKGMRIFLDELSPAEGMETDENVSCGPECGQT